MILIFKLIASQIKLKILSLSCMNDTKQFKYNTTQQNFNLDSLNQKKTL